MIKNIGFKYVLCGTAAAIVVFVAHVVCTYNLIPENQPQDETEGGDDPQALAENPSEVGKENDSDIDDNSQDTVVKRGSSLDNLSDSLSEETEQDVDNEEAAELAKKTLIEDNDDGYDADNESSDSDLGNSIVDALGYVLPMAAGQDPDTNQDPAALDEEYDMVDDREAAGIEVQFEEATQALLGGVWFCSN